MSTSNLEEVVDALNAAVRAGYFNNYAPKLKPGQRIVSSARAMRLAPKLLGVPLPPGLTCDFWPTGQAHGPCFELRFYLVRGR